MEWLIGLFIVWVLWKLLTGQARREAILKKAIGDAFLFNAGEVIYTEIYWEAAERFAQDRGAETNRWEDGGYGISFEMLVNREKVSVTFTRNRMNGTVNLSVENTEQLRKRVMKDIGIKI